jgi:tetratricopeptide (TPR) repeat protein
MKLEDLKKNSWRYAVQTMVKDLTDRIRESPDDPEGYLARGRKYADIVGFHKDAVEDFSKVIELDGSNLLGFYFRGLSLSELGEHTKAIDDYSVAIQIGYSFAPAHHKLGVSYEALGDQKRAIYHYVAAARLDPNTSLYRETLDRYTQAALNQTENPEVLFDQGMVWKEMHEYGSAIKSFNDVIRLRPDGEDAYIQRARCYQFTREYKLASEDYTEVFRLRYPAIGPCRERGYCYQIIGEYQKAIDDYTTAINEDTNYYKTYLHRATCYREIGLDEEAERDYKKSAELE